MTLVHGHEVSGRIVDSQTRCAHYDSELDIIAIKFFCCGRWYPCFKCHRETESHTAGQWPADKFTERAVLCGTCGSEITINEYLDCGFHCPSCRGPFNPGCAKHYGLYFQI